MSTKSDPSFFHFNKLKIYLHPEVYEPAEDTFLLVDYITIRSHQTVLEIGAGTGMISLFCAQKGANVICSDINPYAINLIKKNIRENDHHLNGSIQVRTGNLFEILESHETFDLILFNPPYLPTTAEQKKGISTWYASSFDGGPSGLILIKKYITGLSPHLKPSGKAYFISSSFSNLEKINKYIESSSLTQTIVKQLRCDDEILQVHQLKIKFKI